MDYDFGSDFDLGSFEDIDLSGLGDIDLSGLGDIDLSGLENIDLSGLEGLDLDSIAELGIGDFNLSDDFGGGGTDFGTDAELKKYFDSQINGLDLDAPSSRSLGDGAGMDDSYRDEKGLDDLMMRLTGDGGLDRGMQFDGAGQPDNPLYSDTSEDVQPWQNLEGSGSTKLSDAYKFEDGEWSIRGYYDEEKNQFIPDPNGPLIANKENDFDPLGKSGTNKESMDKYTYDKKSGTWTTPTGETYTPEKPPSHTAKSGAQVMVNAGALPPGYAGLNPEKGSTADTSRTGTSGKDGSSNKSGTGEKKDDWMKWLMMLMALDAMRNKGGGSSGAVIPSLTAGRSTTPYAEVQKAPGYRPGQGGVQYFGPTVYRAAGGGIGALDAAGGRLLRGPGDGVSDDIVAQIGDSQPARLADGEYVLDARTVSEIGNGSTDAGAEKIAQMVERIHDERRNAKRGEPSKADRKLLA